MGYPVKWDAARRSYILVTGRYSRVWAVKFITEKVKSAISNSEACMKCEYKFVVDSLGKEVFFWHAVINGGNKQDVEACDSHVFSVILKELETLGMKHRVGRLSYPDGYVILLR